eukprot:188964_1
MQAQEEAKSLDQNDIKEDYAPNTDRVLRADPSLRYVFFFADKADSNYCLNPYQSDEYHPFYIVDENRYAYLCTCTDTRPEDERRTPFMFNIVSVKNESTEQQKNNLIKSNGCFPQQDAQTLAWTWTMRAALRGGDTIFYIDFNNWNNWTKHNHYESIATSIMEFVLSGSGKEIAPLSVLRIIFQTFHFLCRKRNLLRKSNVRNIFSKALNTC